MSLENVISVKAHYTRSINVERHKNSHLTVSSYLPTSRAINTLERVAETLKDIDTPRSWSLVGPYGSGKSAFAVFLSSLLNKHNKDTADSAIKTLSDSDSNLADNYQSLLKDSSGFLPILISGSNEPLTKRIVKAIFSASKDFWKSQEVERPKLLLKLERAAASKSVSATDLVELVSELQTELSNISDEPPKGILIVIDELGKFLEYESRHEGNGEIFALQSLSELAAHNNDTKLLIFALLHKSFEHYAKGMTEQAKNQWAAIQGRFEEIPFLENTEQVLRVVSLAIEQNDQVKSNEKLKEELLLITDTLDKENALPTTINKKQALEIFLKCYPLHPCSAILLPQLCQKVAQNERTLFSYLGSNESFGFHRMLQELNNIGDWVLPNHIYDYFIANQSAVLGDFQAQRRWIEVVTALERLGDAPYDVINLLKTIGVMNILGSRGGFKPSEALLRTCYKGDMPFEKALDVLIEKSIITHRKFNNEYRVWQGSDFDLQDALNNELARESNYSLAEELSFSNPMPPIVARKYSITTGTLRHFKPYFADEKTISTFSKKSGEPRIIFYLAQNSTDKAKFAKTQINNFSELDIIASVDGGGLLASVTSEIKAYSRISTRAEIKEDKVARRELDTNLDAAVQIQQKLLKDLIYKPENALWFWRGKTLDINSRREIQAQLSAVLEKVFSKTPHVFNELINQDKPSSQASSGRNRLMKAMLKNFKEAELGIQKYPPEKAMYKAILESFGLHRKIKGAQHWSLDECIEGSYYETWFYISNFIDETENGPRSLAELSDSLTKPPFGIKKGLLPIFYLHAYLVYKDDIALFEEGKYQPFMTEEQVERFVKRPDLFTFQMYKIEGLNASLMSAYNKALFDDKKHHKDKVIELARPLVKLVNNLTDNTKKTNSSRLSRQAIKVRNAFLNSKTPEQLMFSALPKALEINISEANDTIDHSLFSERLRSALAELKYAYREMLKYQMRNISQSLHTDDFEELSELPLLRTQLEARYLPLRSYSQGIDNTRGFIEYIIDRKLEDEAWLENILMYLSKSHPTKWRDQDEAAVEAKLADFARRLRELEALRLETERHDNTEGDFDVIVLRTIAQGREPKEKPVTISRTQRREVNSYVSDIKDILDSIGNDETKFAVLATLTDGELSD